MQTPPSTPGASASTTAPTFGRYIASRHNPRGQPTGNPRAQRYLYDAAFRLKVKGHKEDPSGAKKRALSAFQKRSAAYIAASADYCNFVAKVKKFQFEVDEDAKLMGLDFIDCLLPDGKRKRKQVLILEEYEEGLRAALEAISEQPVIKELKTDHSADAISRATDALFTKVSNTYWQIVKLNVENYIRIFLKLPAAADKDDGSERVERALFNFEPDVAEQHGGAGPQGVLCTQTMDPQESGLNTRNPKHLLPEQLMRSLNEQPESTCTQCQSLQATLQWHWTELTMVKQQLEFCQAQLLVLHAAIPATITTPAHSQIPLATLRGTTSQSAQASVGRVRQMDPSSALPSAPLPTLLAQDQPLPQQTVASPSPTGSDYPDGLQASEVPDAKSLLAELIKDPASMQKLGSFDVGDLPPDDLFGKNFFATPAGHGASSSATDQQAAAVADSSDVRGPDLYGTAPHHCAAQCFPHDATSTGSIWVHLSWDKKAESASEYNRKVWERIRVLLELGEVVAFEREGSVWSLVKGSTGKVTVYRSPLAVGLTMFKIVVSEDGAGLDIVGSKLVYTDSHGKTHIAALRVDYSDGSTASLCVLEYWDGQKDGVASLQAAHQLLVTEMPAQDRGDFTITVLQPGFAACSRMVKSQSISVKKVDCPRQVSTGSFASAPASPPQVDWPAFPRSRSANQPSSELRAATAGFEDQYVALPEEEQGMVPERELK